MMLHIYRSTVFVYASRCAGILFLFFAMAGAAHADSVAELQALVEASDAQAWEMAQRMEDQNAGDPEFDFWYALAAKAANRKHEAEFALERVVAQQPANLRARLELGDIYYQFGNTGEAKTQFETVLAATPPDAVQQRIRTYLGAIEAKDDQAKISLNSYVTLSGGYDSNINGATSTVTHDIPGIAVPMTLGASALETDTGYADLRVGLDLVQPTSQRNARFLSAVLQAHDNSEIFSGGNFDYTQASLTGGWMLRRNTGYWRIPLAVQALRVEDDESRYLISAGVERNQALSVNTAMSWFGQVAVNHFPSQVSRNTQQLLLGGAWQWNSTASPLRLTASGNLGYEPAEDSNYDFNGRYFAATRLSLRYSLSSSQTVYGAAGIQQSIYMEDHPLIGSARQDFLADVSAGWQWQLDRAWTVNADLTFADNMSASNDLFDYQRSTVALGATWRF